MGRAYTSEELCNKYRIRDPVRKQECLDLFHKNIKFAHYVVARYFYQFIADEEIQQIALLGLWKSAVTFDPSKEVQFTTYSYHVIRSQINIELRARKNQNGRGKFILLSLDEVIPGFEDDRITLGDLLEDPKQTDHADATIINIVLERVLLQYPENQRKIFQMFIDGYKQTEIEKKVNLSQAHVSRIIKKIRNHIKKELGLDV